MCFEDRLSEIFSRNLGSETSLEVLCYGIPKEAILISSPALKNAVECRYSNSRIKCDRVLEIEIAQDFRIRVQYEMSVCRWFSTDKYFDHDKW